MNLGQEHDVIAFSRSRLGHLPCELVGLRLRQRACWQVASDHRRPRPLGPERESLELEDEERLQVTFAATALSHRAEYARASGSPRELAWRPQMVDGVSRLLVPDAPVDLDSLARSLVDETDSPLGEDDESELDLETLDFADMLRSEGLVDERLLLSLDWPEGNYSLLVLTASRHRGYITIPGEWEGDTWPWTALAAVEPPESTPMLTEFICSFIDSRGAAYLWSGCFPTWIEDHWTVEIGPLVERSRVDASIESWRRAVKR